MALIYSRPRIRIPNICVYHHHRERKNNKKMKKLSSIVIVILLVICLGTAIVKAIEPVFNRICSNRAKGIATMICSQQTTQCIQGYRYSDFCDIHKNEKDNIVMIQSNMVNINKIISDIAERIQIEIDKQQSEKIYIRAGNFTGITLLAGRGPKIPIRIATIGNVVTDVKSEFVAQGVNQTLHRLYLEVKCEISILTPFNTINDTITNQFILTENIIVGEIPSTYYNLNGIESSNLLDTLQ